MDWRFSNLRRIIWILACASVPVAVSAETLEVAQDATRTITAKETYAASEIHGVLEISGSQDAWGGISHETDAAACSLGTNAGDRAAINIGDYGRIEKGVFKIGGANGSGCITIGGKRPNDKTDTPWNGADTHLAIGGLDLSADATSESGVIDVLRLNAGAAAGFIQGSASRQRFVNASSQSDMRILFNGGYFAAFNGFSTTYFFTTAYNTFHPDDVPSGKGGRKIILEGLNGHTIDLRFVNGAVTWASYGTVNFRGDGDVKLTAYGTPYIYGWYWNLDGACWQQRGDLILNGGFRFICQNDNVLPYAATNGIVRVEGNAYGYLDTSGRSSKLNGLVVGNSTCVTNSSTTASVLTFGTGTPDSVLSVAHVGGAPITARFTGTGTFAVSNTPAFPALDVQSGTLRVTGNCTVGQLALRKGVTVVVDGGTLAVTNGYSDTGATLTFTNGGKLYLGLDCPDNRKVTLGGSGSLSTTIEKTGSGRLDFYSSGTICSDVHVAAGSVGFATIGTTNHWLRFSFTQMYNNENFQLSEMRILDSEGARVDGGGSVVSISSGVGAGTDGSAVLNVESTCEPKDMPQRTVWASDSNWLLNEPAGGYRDRTPSAIFDGQTWTRLRYSTSCSAASPKVFVVRLPDAATEVYSYTFRNGYSGRSHPSAWTVETSPDGVAWTTCDTQSGQTLSSANSQYYNGGTPYLVYAGRTGAAGLLAGANVRVDRGATFDATGVAGGQTLDCLTVDCAAGTGDGTLRNVRLAATGTIDLLNASDDAPITLPLVFADSVTTGPLSGWSVRVNGVAKPKWHLAWCGERLTVLGSGLTIIFR